MFTKKLVLQNGAPVMENVVGGSALLSNSSIPEKRLSSRETVKKTVSVCMNINFSED